MRTVEIREGNKVVAKWVLSDLMSTHEVKRGINTLFDDILYLKKHQAGTVSSSKSLIRATRAYGEKDVEVDEVVAE